jgi:hypothetical protein
MPELSPRQNRQQFTAILSAHTWLRSIMVKQESEYRLREVHVLNVCNMSLIESERRAGLPR